MGCKYRPRCAHTLSVPPRRRALPAAARNRPPSRSGRGGWALPPGAWRRAAGLALRQDLESRVGRSSRQSLPSGVRVCRMIPGPCAPRLAWVDAHRALGVGQRRGLGLGTRAGIQRDGGRMVARWPGVSFLGSPWGWPARGSPKSRLEECWGLGVPRRAGYRLNPGKQG